MRRSLASRAIFTFLCAVSSLSFAGSAVAVTVDLAPSKDNTLIETPVDNSNGIGDGIYVGRVGPIGGSTSRRGLIAFNLSSIPANSTINAVSLTLEMAQTTDLTARTISLHRASADWGEAGSSGLGFGGLAQPGDATWIYRNYNTVSWTTAGGDFVATASASQTVAGVGPYVWSSAALVSDVQAWIANPASNFGWLILGDESTTQTVRKFYSREGFTPPRLTVDYTPSTDVPAGGVEAVVFSRPWPAPATGAVNLSYALPRAASVSLSIHDAMGRLVRRVVDHEVETAGRHATVWDGRTESGADAGAGVYLASLVVDGVRYQRRIPMLR